MWTFEAFDILNCSCQGLFHSMIYIFVGHWTLETLHHKLICNQIFLIFCVVTHYHREKITKLKHALLHNICILNWILTHFHISFEKNIDVLSWKICNFHRMHQQNLCLQLVFINLLLWLILVLSTTWKNIK